ncbi:Glutathione gamma-glutamylcysteinyltransferase 3 [Glycine soja]
MHSEAKALEHMMKRDRGHQSVSLENKTGDSTVVKMREKNNNVDAGNCMILDDHEGEEHCCGKGTNARSVSFFPRSQEKIGDSAKVVIKQDMKGGEHKYGFNNNKLEKPEKVRVVDDETGDKHELYMIISRLNRAPSILYIVSYRHEGWSSVAKSLTEDVPRLLKSEDLKDIQEVLSLAFKSPPSELRGLITWIVEVRRQEDGNLTLSEEEKGRLAIKADILEQIRTTRLFKHVTRLGLSGGKCCSQIDVKHMNADSENPVTLVSGTVTTGGGSEQGVDVLVPLCQREPSRLCLSNEGHCIGMHPSTADVLTMFLLALPLHTWSGIKEEKLRVEALNPLATEDLPPLLQEEHPNPNNPTQVFSFNYKPLLPYGSINDIGMFYGMKYFNDLLMEVGPTGNVQSELLMLGYGTWLCLFSMEGYDRNDGSRKRMSFQKIDTLT